MTEGRAVMKLPCRMPRRLANFVTAFVALMLSHASAQVPPQDAPFVPTPQPVVEAMLQLAGVRADDIVYDLGSGDGRVVITAARKFGARAVGVELDSHLVIQSEEAARQAGVERRAVFLEQDLFKVDLAEATVVTMYLWPRMYDKLAPRLASLRPGTRILIYRWGFTEWKPDRRGGSGDESYFLYVVPARLAGKWRLRVTAQGGATRDYEVEFQQRYQELTANARDAAGAVPVPEASIEGDRVRFTLGEGAERRAFEGQVSGSTITGTTPGTGVQGAVTWRAERLAAEGKP